MSETTTPDLRFAIEPFDPKIHISPYTLHRRLDSGQPPRLVDVRDESLRERDGARTFRHAQVWSPEAEATGVWAPVTGNAVGVDTVLVDDTELFDDTVLFGDTVLFDDEGDRSSRLARAGHAQGHASVRALYGGLKLYDFAIDPLAVVGHRFLR